MSRMLLFLLGPPRIERDGEAVEVDTRKAVALAAYLAVTGRRHSRDSLAALLWPESDRAHARAALRRTLAALKKALGDEWLQVEGDSLALERGDGFWMDVDHFHDLVAECQRHGHPVHHVCPTCFTNLTKAVSLYRDDLLAGFTLRDSPAFDEWRFFESERLREMLDDALERLVRYHAARAEHEHAIAHAQRWLALDPLNETAHQCLIYLYAQAGQRPAALRQYHECARVLKREVGVLPQKETTQLYWAVRKRQFLPAMMLSKPFSARPHNLSLQPTSFFGREGELSRVKQLLGDPSRRLVTLTGPAGAGKTRLAIQAAWRIADGEGDGFAHGVYFVPLAPLDSPDSLVPTIANSIGFSLYGSASPQDQLVNYLRAKDVLLVLDNFEHLLDGAGLLAEILSSAPGVKLLVTSRERLGLQWERPLEIRGLEVPQDGEGSALEVCAAVQVFLQSAGRVAPEFLLSETERPYVARICRYLEGIPLAIELAAAWVETFSCREIAQEIECNLGLLAASSRDVPERHHSLRAAFDHSWNLLAAEERDLFARLAVFRGGFSREAAEAVADASLLHLSALTHKSLLQREAMGRYRMLHVLRQYAEEKLRDTPEWARTCDRHCEYYADFLHQREQDLRGKRQQEVLREITGAIEDVRAGWQWAVARRKGDAITHAMESLHSYYDMQSWFEEGERAFGRAADEWRKAVDEDGEGESREANAELSESRVILGGLLARQGRFHHRLAHSEEAQRTLEEGLSILRPLGVHREVASALASLGSDAEQSGDYDDAKRLYQESLAMYEELGDRSGTASCFNNMGITAYLGEDFIQARKYYQEALEIWTDLGDQYRRAAVLNNLGNVLRELREYAEAEALYQQAIPVWQEMGNKWVMACICSNQGLVAEALGEHDKAQRLLWQSLTLYQEVGNRDGVARVLNNLGFVLCAVGEYETANEHFHTALGMAADTHIPAFMLDALLGIGAVLAQEEEQKEHAVELVALVLSHPAAYPETKGYATRLLSELEPQLPALVFAAAQERGKAGELEHYVGIYETYQSPQEHEAFR